MALDSLLASMKNEVSGVSGVQPCSHAGLQRYPMKFAGVSGVSQPQANALPDTPDTSSNPQGYQRKPAPVKACTPDTPDTPKNINVCGDTATASVWWLLHYRDRNPLEIALTPPATHAQVLAWHPEAVAAIPIQPERGA